MAQKWNEKALAFSLAILSAACMLLLGILGNLGIYTGAVQAMQNWHLFFNLSVVGIIGGMIEATIISFIAGWLIAWLYNKFI
jgi:ABC-type antimicrobial peptide transport system permease subunit